jgi:hypothetical protein
MAASSIAVARLLAAASIRQHALVLTAVGGFPFAASSVSLADI